jgi:hypothetical protein
MSAFDDQDAIALEAKMAAKKRKAGREIRHRLASNVRKRRRYKAAPSAFSSPARSMSSALALLSSRLIAAGSASRSSV